MNHKRKRPKDRRAGCLMCKYWKSNGLKGKRRRATGDSVTRQEARANTSFRHQMKAVALALLLLAAPLAAQEPVDTARATAELAISFDPGAIVVRGDTTFVFVSTTIESDSLASAVDRASLALQAAILRDGGQAQKSGPPGWFYGGVLLSAAGFVLAYAFKDETTTINVNQSQEQTTTVTRRFPWCWPGFGKGKDRECEDE